MPLLLLELPDEELDRLLEEDDPSGHRMNSTDSVAEPDELDELDDSDDEEELLSEVWHP